MLPEKAFVDFETASEANIKKVGARRYLLDPSTDILMLSWWIRSKMDRGRLWLPGDPFPPLLLLHIQNGGLLSGWNSMSFERIAWKHIGVPRYGFPEVEDWVWYDTMHRAAAANLPRSLDGAARAVGAAVQKDKVGHNLMVRVTNKLRTPVITKEDYDALGSYCVDDGGAEATTDDGLPPWPDVWPWNRIVDVDREINDRGVLMDVKLVEGLAKAASDELIRLDHEMGIITGDPSIKTSSVGKIKAWLLQQGVKLPLIDPEADEEENEDDNDEDGARDTLKAYRMRKSDIADLLASKDLSNTARAVLEMRAEAAKASTKKLKAMLTYADPDGRLRDAFKLLGAQTTARWCLAEGSPVIVKSNGNVYEKPIEKVLLTDEVWDGDEWVRHDGVMFSGVKNVIEHDGVWATAEHEVYVSDENKIRLGEAKRTGTRLFIGNGEALFQSILHSVTVGETVLRHDKNDVIETVVRTCNVCQEENEQDAFSVRNKEIRFREHQYVLSGGWVDWTRSHCSRSEYDSSGQYDRPVERLQPFARCRGLQRRINFSSVVGEAKAGSSNVCSLPAEVECGSQSRPSKSYSRTYCCAAQMAERKPNTGSRECQTRPCFCQNVEKNESVTEPAIASVNKSWNARTRVSSSANNQSTVGETQSGTVRRYQHVNKRECKKARCFSITRSKSNENCAVESCSCYCGRNKKKSTSKRGTCGLLDARTKSGKITCNEGAVFEGANCHEKKVRTYDIINAGSRNRFMAWGRIVSNSGAGWQPHNFPRVTISDQYLAAAVLDGRTGNADWIRPLWGNVLPWAAKMLRRCLCAPAGRTLLQGDFAQIEARITAWLAGQQNIVDAFARGEDVYKIAAAPIFNKRTEDITKEERQIGKICIAEGQLVLTDHGLVAIENVTVEMKVWDGIEWVTHGGAVCNGTQEVMEYDGLCATRDHRVWVEELDESIALESAAADSLQLLVTGNGGTEIRLGGGNKSRNRESHKRKVLRTGSMRGLRTDKLETKGQLDSWKKQRLSLVQPAFEGAEVSNENSSLCKREMPESKYETFSKLRCAWNRVSVSIRIGRWFVGLSQHWSSCRESRVRTGGQQSSLRAWQSSVGRPENTVQQSSNNTACELERRARLSFTRSAFSMGAKTKMPLQCRCSADNNEALRQRRSYVGSDRQSPSAVVVPVWDILNAGPRHRFTVSDRLVSNCVLGLGFGGGANVFAVMSMNSDVRTTKEEAQPIVAAWREANPYICQFWRDCEIAIIAAIQNPGFEYKVGITQLVSYFVLNNCLHCRLPSGRFLRYWAPVLQDGFWPDGNYRGKEITYLRVKGPNVFRAKLYGGLATENLAQAIAADLLAGGLVRLTDAGFEIVLHVHDSIAAEIDEGEAEAALPDFKRIMSQPEAWAVGLPIGADCHIGSRFG